MTDMTRARRHLSVAFIALPALLLACTASGPGASQATPGPSGGSSATPSGSPAASLLVAVPADVLGPLLDDAATRTGAARDGITVTEATAVTWPTGALGCPSPGVLYTQALVRGWQVILDAGGTRIDYRASGPGRFRICEGIGG